MKLYTQQALYLILIFIPSLGLAQNPSAYLVEDFYSGTGSGNPRYITEFNNELYFSAWSNSPVRGRELYKYDGDSIQLVQDINTGLGATNSDPSNFYEYAGDLYFQADDGVHGKELWRYDGNSAMMVADISTGAQSSEPRGFYEYQGDLYFAAEDTVNGRELWKFDGSTVSMVRDLYPGPQGSRPGSFVEYNGELFFRILTAPNNYFKIAKYDGSTFTVGAISNLGSGNPRIVYQNELYLSAIGSSGGSLTGTELWKYDGTHLQLVEDINPNGSSGAGGDILEYQNKLFFTADDGVHGKELWVSNGDSAELVTDYNPGTMDGVINLFNDTSSNIIFIRGIDATNGVELLQYSGGTISLAEDINPGPNNSGPTFFEWFDGQLYFLASIPNKSGAELWSYGPCPHTSFSTVTDTVCGEYDSPSGNYTWTTSGTYRDTVTNYYSCDSIITFNLTIQPNPNLTLIDPVDEICIGVDVILKAIATQGDTLFWSDGYQNNDTIKVWNKDTFYVTAIHQNGCRQVDSLLITPYMPPTDVIVQVNQGNSNCGGLCNGEAIASPVGGSPPYSYQWTDPDSQVTARAEELCQGEYYVQAIGYPDCASPPKKVKIEAISTYDPQVYLTNIAAVDTGSISIDFDGIYGFNLPESINAPASNPQNYVDPGKKVRFKVEVKNEKISGQSVVSGICVVRSTSPYVLITDSTSALNNIAWGSEAWSFDEFEIEIDSLTPPGSNVYIDFVVKEGSAEYVTHCIPIPIHPLDYSISPGPIDFIDDDNNPDSQGNDNDTVEVGETIEFFPLLSNYSSLDAEYVRGVLSNLDDHTFLNIWNADTGVNTVVYDASWWNYSFGQPNTIPAGSIGMSPEFDFVFDYLGNEQYNDFNLYLKLAGGFQLFGNSNSLSLVQWTLPYTFNETGGDILSAKSQNPVIAADLYPNPTSGNFTLDVGEKLDKCIVIIHDIHGKAKYRREFRNTSQIKIEAGNLVQGQYLVSVLTGVDILHKKLIIQQ